MHIKIIHFQVSFFYIFCRAARQAGGGVCITREFKLVFRIRESTLSARGHFFSSLPLLMSCRFVGHFLSG